MSRSAVICVDVQNDFLPGGSLAVSNGDAVIPELVNAILNISPEWVICTRDWHPADHCSFKENGGIWPTHCVKGTHGAMVATELTNLAEVMISKGMYADKEAYSGFDGTRLNQLLTVLEIEEVYIGGLATDYCVSATVLDSLENGFKTFVIEDACRAVNVNPGDGEVALDAMKLAGAKII
jgi:nicotinamidase/pyrazinamidase